MVSVIVAVYNVEKYIEKCIESIRNQTYKELEIILVDDGSVDSSGEICDRFEREDVRIRVLHKQNGGLSDARNAGINLAKGEYLSFVDGDDYIHPQMLELLLHNLQTYGGDIALCSFIHVSEAADTVLCDVTNHVRKEEVPLRELMTSASEIASACNKLYKRELFCDIRYPKGKLHEDEYVIHKLLDKSGGIVCTDAKLYYYVKREGSITSRVHAAKIEDMLGAMLERFALLKERELMEIRHYTERMVIGNLEYTYAVSRKGMCDKAAVSRTIKKGVRQVLHSNKDILSTKEKAGLLCFSVLPAVWVKYKKWSRKNRA